MEENERLAVLVDNAEHDVRHVTELLDKSDKERKRLSDRNAQLTMNGMTFVFFYFALVRTLERVLRDGPRADVRVIFMKGLAVLLPPRYFPASLSVFPS